MIMTWYSKQRKSISEMKLCNLIWNSKCHKVRMNGTVEWDNLNIHCRHHQEFVGKQFVGWFPDYCFVKIGDKYWNLQSSTVRFFQFFVPLLWMAKNNIECKIRFPKCSARRRIECGATKGFWGIILYASGISPLKIISWVEARIYSNLSDVYYISLRPLGTAFRMKLRILLICGKSDELRGVRL